MSVLRGSGTYGSVVSPPVASPQFSLGFVGKILFTADEDSQSEWRVACKLRTVDPTLEYLVYPLHATTVSHADVRTMVPRRFHSQEYVQFIMPDAGSTLYECISGSERLSLDKMLNISSDIASGIQLMTRSDVLHRDLHARNIVIQDGRCRIIDWGLALIDASCTYYTDETLEWCASYAVHPPDIRLAYGVSYVFKNEMKLLKEHLGVTGKEANFLFRNIRYRASYNRMASAVCKLTKVYPATEILKQLNSHVTSDVYALGLCMLRMFIMCGSANCRRARHLRTLIIKMMYADPQERLKIDDVVDQLQSIRDM